MAGQSGTQGLIPGSGGSGGGLQPTSSGQPGAANAISQIEQIFGGGGAFPGSNAGVSAGANPIIGGLPGLPGMSSGGGGVANPFPITSGSTGASGGSKM